MSSLRWTGPPGVVPWHPCTHRGSLSPSLSAEQQSRLNTCELCARPCAKYFIGVSQMSWPSASSLRGFKTKREGKGKKTKRFRGFFPPQIFDKLLPYPLDISFPHPSTVSWFEERQYHSTKRRALETSLPGFKPQLHRLPAVSVDRLLCLRCITCQTEVTTVSTSQSCSHSKASSLRQGLWSQLSALSGSAKSPKRQPRTRNWNCAAA